MTGCVRQFDRQGRRGFIKNRKDIGCLTWRASNLESSEPCMCMFEETTTEDLTLYLQESGPVFRKVQQDGRFSRLGGVNWSIGVGH